ncbi:MAG: branched-chain amino acid ABC transporter substrate-binding protein [Desulfobulbaceae bacterium A2]|nr:MAG: branched-chain amino acid ABC transporter substrate-binding protein [Desulfobulbaceae bacterium A2]
MKTFNRAVQLTLGCLCLLVLGPRSLAAAEPIKIGAILAVTGPASFLGAPEARTVEMLAEALNAKGGIQGRKVELLIKDSAGEPEKAISLARQLIEEEKVLAIIGPSTSGETMKIKAICEQGKTPLVSCAAAEVIVKPVARYVFKVAPNDSHAARKIFAEMQARGLKRIAVLASNTGFGQAGKKQLVDIAPEFGIQILAEEVYDKGATDLSAVVAKLMANKELQAVVNWSIEPVQSIIAKNMRQAGWNVPLFQSHGFANIKYAEAAGAAAEGIIFPAGRLLVAGDLPAGHPQKGLLADYARQYEERFKEQASTFGGHGWDALQLLVAAIEQGGAERDKVRDALEKTAGFAGIGGVFTFSAEDHGGLALDAFEMLTVKQGRFVPYVREK